MAELSLKPEVEMFQFDMIGLCGCVDNWLDNTLWILGRTGRLPTYM